MDQTEIINYIPQRAPFVMVDEVLQADEHISKTKFEIRPDNLFVKNGEFIEPGLVENMAQTAGAGTGYRYQSKGEVVPVGFIASIKGLEVLSLPKVGDVLETSVVITHKVMNVYVVECTVYLNEEKVASCEMKIFEQSEK
ncbi:MAG: 3-hydroxyacyl-ACP dehydratase [Flavipsychrobacter sp.]